MTEIITPDVLLAPEVIHADELTPEQKEIAEAIKRIAEMSPEREKYIDRVIQDHPPENVIKALKWIMQTYHDRFLDAAGLEEPGCSKTRL
jgi:hypothetical protein